MSTKPEMPEAVLVIVHVPASFRGLSVAEVRRKLAHPRNVEATLDSIADSDRPVLQQADRLRRGDDAPRDADPDDRRRHELMHPIASRRRWCLRLISERHASAFSVHPA
jgi:hypothetical protein